MSYTPELEAPVAIEAPPHANFCGVHKLWFRATICPQCDLDAREERSRLESMAFLAREVAENRSQYCPNGHSRRGTNRTPDGECEKCAHPPRRRRETTAERLAKARADLAAGPLRCRAGHALSGINVYRKYGKKHCRACSRASRARIMENEA